MMAGILAGKSALVTGGASGIGRATALALVREGARVAVADQTEARAAETVAMLNAGGGQAIAIGADVADEAQIQVMVARSVAAFGRLDCAFNNAGIAPRNVGPAGQRTHEMSRQSFDAMLAVNLTGVFLCLKHEIVQMLAQGGGRLSTLRRSQGWLDCRRPATTLRQSMAWWESRRPRRWNMLKTTFG
jgi:NAD(P)-dependent dehydrogenase (short-subunit alcohol dehydrogenase family)